MAKIKKIAAREVLDSRGIPTIEANLELDDGNLVHAQASSGQSLGSFEGRELRDHDPKRYNGFGVSRAVAIINSEIGPKLTGVDVSRHFEIDEWLTKADGTHFFEHLGVNTVITLSQLTLKAQAMSQRVPLYEYVASVCRSQFQLDIKLEKIPSPIFTVLNGGKHGVKNLDFQEFHVVPATSLSFSASLEMVVSLYDNLRSIFKRRNMPMLISEEGGFSPTLYSNEEGFSIIKEALHDKGLKLGVDIFTGLDCAASFYYNNAKYTLKDIAAPLKTEKYLEFMRALVDKYNILILEDPIQEQDDDTWTKFTKTVGKQCYVVADDFASGDSERLKKVIKSGGCNAVLIKFNQVGTMYQIIELAKLVKTNGLKLIFSQRLGETTDSIIADIAVGLQADFVKFGPPSGGERVVKYNRLLHIEELLNK